MGGDPIAAFRYIKDNSTGLDSEADYPYDQHTNPFRPPQCKAPSNTPVAKVTSWAYAVPRCPGGSCSSLERGDTEIALMAAVTQYGPVSVCIDAEDNHVLRQGLECGQIQVSQHAQ